MTQKMQKNDQYYPQPHSALVHAWYGLLPRPRIHRFIALILALTGVIGWISYRMLLPGFPDHFESVSDGTGPYVNTNGTLRSELVQPDTTNHLLTMTEKNSAASLTLLLDSPVNRTSATEIKKNTKGRDILAITDFQKDTDLTYQIIQKGIKKHIILKTDEAIAPDIDQHPDQPFTYNFLLSLQGNSVSDSASGPLHLLAEGSGGKVDFTLRAPIMRDAKGDQSESILMGTIPTNEPGVYRLLLAPDVEWLADPKRAFPITIETEMTKDTEGTK